jgi:hypothetical protein
VRLAVIGHVHLDQAQVLLDSFAARAATNVRTSAVAGQLAE